MDAIYIRATTDVSRDGRERGVRVAGHPAEYGVTSVVTVNMMIDGPDVSTGQRNLTPDEAREMARALDEAVTAAEAKASRLNELTALYDAAGDDEVDVIEAVAHRARLIWTCPVTPWTNRVGEPCGDCGLTESEGREGGRRRDPAMNELCPGSGQLLTGIVPGRDYTALCPVCDQYMGIAGPADRPAICAHAKPRVREQEAVALRDGPTLGL